MLEARNTDVWKPSTESQKLALMKPEVKVFVLREENESYINQILSMEDRLSDKMKYARKDVLDSIRNQNELLICYIEDKKVLGYLVTQTHNSAIAELKEEDPELIPDDERYYVDRIAVLPEVDKELVFGSMLNVLSVESKLRNVNRFSSHIRMSNHLNEAIKFMLRKILTYTRPDVVLPRHGEGLFEYMEFINL